MTKFKSMSGLFCAATLALGACDLATGPGSRAFEYQLADEATQQEHLDMIIKGFEHGFNMTAGNDAVIESATADANHDRVAIVVRMTDKRVNMVNVSQVTPIKNEMREEMCKQGKKDRILEQGITMDVIFKRPNGTQLMKLRTDARACGVEVKQVVRPVVTPSVQESDPVDDIPALRTGS